MGRPFAKKVRDGYDEGVNVARKKSVRSELYKDARVLGNVEAVVQGPGSYGKRLARRKVYATTNGLTRKFLRALGLSK